MSPCSDNRSNVRRKIALITVFALAVVLYGVAVTTWITTGDNSERNRLLESHQLNLKCFACANDKGTVLDDGSSCQSIEQECERMKWLPRNKLPAACKYDPDALEFLQKEVRRKFDAMERDHAKYRLKKKGELYLQEAQDSFDRAANTLLIQWSPLLPNSTERDEEGWQTIKEFRHQQSTFGIVRGPVDAHHSGKIRITETGLYLIYARLTFSCDNPDGRENRIFMEIIAHVMDRKLDLLRDMQTATCSVKGDLVTLYQSGIFRLGPRYHIGLRYKTPNGITLSRESSTFKSNMGLVRLGLA